MGSSQSDKEQHYSSMAEAHPLHTSKNPPPKNPLKIVEQLTLKARMATEKQTATTPVQLFLPGFRIGTLPNHINRSSLYAPIARGKRRFFRQEPIVTRSDVSIYYTGEQLDEADADLTMALIFSARTQLGVPTILNRAALLRVMKRSVGKHDYEWLHRRMKALTECTIFIEAKTKDGTVKLSVGKTHAFHILNNFAYDECTGIYSYTLDPRWVQLFGNREYAHLDWDKRLRLRRNQDMAKTLQRLIATSSNNIQRYSLDWLQMKMQYKSPRRKFRDAIMKAIHELERMAIISKGRIEASTKQKEQLMILKYEHNHHESG